jgi:diguanylate cyclase (GGDEF)-like protein
MYRGPVALLALFYACAIALWAVGLARGWTTLGAGEWVYVLVVGLYASLSIAALHQRGNDARVRIFVASQAVAALTIVWPQVDLEVESQALLWFTVLGGSLVYTLPLPLYLHLASVIPDRHRLAQRGRWFVPVHYAAALVIAAFTALMYADQIRLARGATTTILPMRLDLDSVYQLDSVLNTGGYLYGGIGALILLGTAALRYRSMQARRQALIVFAGIAPWTIYAAWSFANDLIGAGAALPDWELGLQAAMILLEAVSLFVAVIGYQLFDMGLVVRRSMIYGSASALCVGALYLTLLGVGELMRRALGVELEAWHLGAALMLVALAFQPMLRGATRVVDAIFFPQKVRLRYLSATLIPSLARRTDLDAVASDLTRRLRRSLGFRSAALLLPDDAREFYRVRALSGEFRFRGQALGAVMTGEDLMRCWIGPRDAVLVRGPGAWSDRLGGGCRDLPGMLELTGADLLVPVKLGEDLVAVLALGGGRVASSLDRDDLAQLEILAQQASAMLENARLFHLARHDALTGLPRRRVFEERLAVELSRAAREFQPIAVAMIDIDDFKDVNDRFGHLVGDRALRIVADVMRNVSRSTDVVARYGGEEFVMLLPFTEEQGARVVAAKLREAIASHAIALGPGVELVLTLSIGLAVVNESDLGHDVQEFVRRADHALYDAKLAGKNRFEVFGARERLAAETTLRVEPRPPHG